MKIGVVSDSHDHKLLLRAAITDAVARGASSILHCGDIVAPSSLERLGHHEVDIHVIHGNNVGDGVGMARLVADPSNRIRYHGQDAELELGGRRIFIVHYPHYARAMAATGDYDLVCCGHTHHANVEMQANLAGRETPIVNPGTIAGLGAAPTYAMVDLSTLKCEIVPTSAD